MHHALGSAKHCDPIFAVKKKPREREIFLVAYVTVNIIARKPHF